MSKLPSKKSGAATIAVGVMWMLGLVATSTDAALLNLIASAGGTTRFTVSFDDTNGDQTLQFAEITEFSGVTFGPTLYDDLLEIPTIAGISQFGGSCPGVIYPTQWCVGNSADQIVAINGDLLNYRIDAIVVPEPATLALLGLGLAGLGFARRKSH